MATDTDHVPGGALVRETRPELPARPGRPVQRMGSPLAAYLGRIHERLRSTTDGAVATYIPELGKADPAWFGIAAATLDGAVHEVGDSGVPFTIQSISKPLTYALAIDDHGEAAVRARIGVEPTGEAFNAITLDRRTGRPLNPMVNAGAIAAAGLIESAGSGSPIQRLLEGYGRFAGRQLTIDPVVEASERATGHRNRAIGHLLRASGALDGDADAAVERYFAQCSVVVTAADLAVIAATLANAGVNPITGERAASAATVRAVLAVMATCGMYDGAGEWMYTVGLPAKSGVAGGILAVVPGRLGLGFFSPPLDAQGNSVRGVLACRDIARDLELHPLGDAGATTGAVRTTYTLADVGSKRGRNPEERTVLADQGRRGVVIELQGAVTFLGAEAVSTSLQDATATRPIACLVVDLRRVERLDGSSIGLLADVFGRVIASGGRVILSGCHRHAAGVETLDRAVAGQAGERLTAINDLDTAIEAAEDILLHGMGRRSDPVLDPESHPILADISGTDRRWIVARASSRIYEPGAEVVRAGDASDELFLVVAGRLSVTVEVPGQGRRRLSTLGPGMAFGETALLGGGRRGADVHADRRVICLVLSTEAFDRLTVDRPDLALTIVRNLLGTATTTTGRLTREMAVLAG